MGTKIFAVAPTASWQRDGGVKIYFPVKSIVETGGNRLVPRERLNRKGAKIDNTSSVARGFTTISRFFNGISEAGVPPNSYPGQLNALIDAMELDAGAAGTLTLQTRGPIRAKPHTWTRTEAEDRVDLSTLQINWILDNEDGQTAATFTPPTARSAVVPLAARVQLQLAAEGAWSFDISNLFALAGALERALLAPLSFADDIESAARGIVESVSRIESAFADAGRSATDPAAALLLAPGASAVLPALRSLSGMASTAQSSAAGASGPIPWRPRSGPRPAFVSLFYVAQDTGQQLDDLLQLNGGLDDLRGIPAYVPILVRR